MATLSPHPPRLAPRRPAPTTPGPAPARAAGPSVRALPAWWREIAATLALYAAYDASRGLRHGDLATADRHGGMLLRWEQSWHLAPEHTLNQFLWHVPALAVTASYFYAALHFIVTPAVLIWLYRRHPDRYRTARTILVVATALALIGFWLFPTTPPRLLPGGTFHDTLADSSRWGWWAGEGSAPRGFGSLTNQVAAMPSLHVGWALWCGWLLARHARRPSVRILGAAYPVLTTLDVMGTGNHYLVDAAAGAGVIALAAAAVRLVPAVLGRATETAAIATPGAVPPPRQGTASVRPGSTLPPAPSRERADGSHRAAS